MRSILLASLIALAGCGGDAGSEFEERAREAVQRFGREDLGGDDIDQAIADLVEACEDSADNYGSWLAYSESDGEFREALAYTCPDVLGE